ncbi:DegT/DnrJ/EryC1/StrS family aminotransferase [Hydrogenophaga sp. MI9]|uniref:DegT/DnrJ/EryC1/StrS family aminotransferase n=1 Tax=Hydrogenophaga sp. MI9 TaxID=3453719 RepID=UPI003EEC03F4
MHPPQPIPPLIPHVRYGSRPSESGWLFFGAARQGMKFLSQHLLRQHPDLLFIVPAYTCDSVVQALDEAGAEMAFVDVAPDLDLDLAAVRGWIERSAGRTVALVPTPLFGAPVRPYKQLFPDCIVIEDRAQTLPDPASGADFQLLSFGPGKQVSGMGGGALLGGGALRNGYAALEQECGAVRHVVLSLVGNLLFGPAWALFGQKVTQRHSANAIDKESRSIDIRALCEDRARWITHSLQTWDGTGRTRIADAYHRSIPQALRFDMPCGLPYLRYPVRASLEGPGISSGRMYEKVVQRAEESSRRQFPGARAVMEASFLPTHHRVTAEHMAWYADRLSGLAGPAAA